MPDCFSNTPYNYQELDYPCWGSPFKFNPGNIYQDSALSQQLYNHDVNTILSTPISYPKVSTPYEMSRPNTSVFQSSNTKAQLVETPHDPLSFELLNGPEAIYNQSRPREQSSAIEPRQQSEKPGESATQSMSPAHLSNSRQLEHWSVIIRASQRSPIANLDKASHINPDTVADGKVALTKVTLKAKLP